MSKMIITAAVTGSIHTPSLSPYLPCDSKAVAEDAIRAHSAGAAVVHVHGRDPKNGRPSSDFALFQEMGEMINAGCNAPVCMTTGGRLDMTMEERLRPIIELKPELASMNTGSLNFYIGGLAAKLKDPKFDWEIPYLVGTENLIFSNTFQSQKRYCAAMYEAGTKPELEVYDSGMINNIKYQIDIGIIKTPIYIQFVLGILGGIPATVQNLVHLHQSTLNAIGEPNFVWSVCAAGKAQLPIMAAAMAMGGNVRVGLEDNLYVGPGQLAKGSYEQVERVVKIAKELSIPIASSDEAREILGLKGLAKVGFKAAVMNATA
jgi:uncharacterized protein (DUF849 family)